MEVGRRHRRRSHLPTSLRLRMSVGPAPFAFEQKTQINHRSRLLLLLLSVPATAACQSSSVRPSRRLPSLAESRGAITAEEGRTEERMLVSGRPGGRSSDGVRACLRASASPTLLSPPPHSDSLAQLFHLDLTAAATAGAVDDDGGDHSSERRERHSRLDRPTE